MSDEVERVPEVPMRRLSHDEELQALRELVISDGWRVYLQHMQQAWGSEAFEEKLNSELEGLPIDERGSVTDRMRDTFRGVRAQARWPDFRIKELEGKNVASPHRPGIIERLYRASRVGQADQVAP